MPSEESRASSRCSVTARPRARLAALVVDLGARVTEVETALDRSAQPFTAAELESTNAALIRCRDALWAIGRDRLRAAEQVSLLAAGDPSDAGLAVLFSVHQAFSALDRLEVRGRDSAGIEVQLTGHGLDPSDPVVAQALAIALGPVVHHPLGPTGRRRAGGRLQGGGRDRRAGRQHGVVAGRPVVGPPARAGAVVTRRRGCRARPHPVGVDRHHLRAQRPSPVLRRDRSGAAVPCRPRCSTATSTTSRT